MLYHIFMLFCLCIFYTTAAVQAKVYWLPDYLVNGIDSTRKTSSAPIKTEPSHSCSTYGYKSANETNGLICSSTIDILGIGECFVDCVHPCDLVTGLTCQYGCKQSFSSCSSKCEICYTDNCRNRTDNRTEYGCSSYWPDCTSKCQTGETCTQTDCTGYVSSLPANTATYKTCTPGCGDNNTRYKITQCKSGYTLKNGSCQDIGSFTFIANSTTNNGVLKFTLTGSKYTIDWGDGKYDNVSSSGTSTKSHTYSSAGNYTVSITGNVTTFINVAPTSGSEVYLTKIIRLNLPSVTKAQLKQNCSNMTGSIPELPPNLVDGEYMFRDCTSLTGSIPELPSTLTKAYTMFYRAYGLNGYLPSKFPSSLTDAPSMFEDCYNLKGSIPALPSNLENGEFMFRGCSGLTGSIPQLPASLSDGEAMFRDCTGLTGTIPTLPSNLVYGSYMFHGCTGLTGGVPNFGNKLTTAYAMFKNCSSLTGTIPSTLPDSLTTCTQMFYGSKLSGSCLPKPANVTSGNCDNIVDKSNITLSTDWSGYTNSCDKGFCTCSIN